MHEAQRLINHVALVLDGSWSMNGHKDKLIEVSDEQIRHLARKSEELSQETRVSIYVFGDTVSCLIYDMDVMRLPSIKDLYAIKGNTALVDATFKSQEDLAQTAQLYGDHAFLTFVLTDGMENVSRFHKWTEMKPMLSQLQENWSIGFLVPSKRGLEYMRNMDVSADWCAIWDTDSALGVVDAAATIRTATDNFMVGRSKGVRGSRNVFSTGTDAVNRTTVTQSLTPLRSNQYSMYTTGNSRIRVDEFVPRVLGVPYVKGNLYYQLTKTENIQASKRILVFDKRSKKVYGGSEGRHLIGLPDGVTVRVKPDQNPDYEIYVQSTSFNRVLVPSTKVIVL